MDYLPTFARAKASLLNSEFKSHYSNSLMWAFDAYPRGALNRNFLPGTHVGVGIDRRSAYPATLYDMSQVPVFSLADEFVEYHGEPLVNYAIYIVENESLTSPEHWIILNAKWNLVSGHTLRNGQLPQSGWTIHAWVKPVHLAENPFPAVFDDVVRCLGGGTHLTPEVKKTLLPLIGLMGKRKKQKVEGHWTNSYEVAHSRVESQYDIFPFADGHVALTRGPAVLLEDGFFPIQFLIYDHMRIALLKSYQLLKSTGLTIYGVHTDCFIVSAAIPTEFAEFYRTNYEPLLHRVANTKEQEAEIKAESERLLSCSEFRRCGAIPELPLVEGKAVETLGQLHREPPPKLASTRLYCVKNNDELRPQTLYTASCRHPSDWIATKRMTDDLRRVHVVQPFSYQNFQIRDGILVLAKCAGAGKTTACLNHCVGKVLVVLPTTKRVASIRRSTADFPASVTSLTAMTTARFVGRQVRQDIGPAPVPPISDFDTIVIDELYLNPICDIIALVKRLETLRESQHQNYKEEWRVATAGLGQELDGVRYEFYKALVLDGFHVPEWAERKEKLEAQFPACAVLMANLDKEQELVLRLRAGHYERAAVLRAELYPGKHTLMFANGDTFQLPGVERWRTNKKAYCDTFLWRVFPNRAMLTTPHRMKCSCGQEFHAPHCDKNKLLGILEALISGKKPAEVTTAFGLQTFGDITQVQSKNLTCLVRTNVFGMYLNERFGGPIAVGSIVVLKKYDSKGKNMERKSDKTLQFSVNELYTVEDIKQRTFLVRASPEAEPRWIPSSHFRRAISWTVDSVQGEKVTENYAIFESDDTSDWRSFYTAVSRAEHLNKVWIYTGANPCPRPELKSLIKKKIEGHAVYDKHGVACDITVQWVLDRLQDNNNECELSEGCICEEAQMKLTWDEKAVGSEEFLRQFSIDRRNPELGLTRANCRLIHLCCNHHLANKVEEE